MSADDIHYTFCVNGINKYVIIMLHLPLKYNKKIIIKCKLLQNVFFFFNSNSD